ncbi:hypothetical protein ANN_12557 [Periplaneta americana]|uniref:Uncharacterized protein n=1 Tax=Periplaneta americana TaxID=6978 RepID=A0ABQ8THI4_PERAM|nr:hypothetical protein ANN_12557 [Periplaneta americana]
MDAIITCPASCEVISVIRFLHAERVNAAEIRRRLCRVYGNIMSDAENLRMGVKMCTMREVKDDIQLMNSTS